MTERALEFLNIPAPAPKPRKNGMTMFTDLGAGLHEQRDAMEMNGQFADFAKLAISMVSLLPKDMLRKKIEIYREFDVDVFPGGVMLENALYHNGIGIADRFFDEMCTLGISTVEVSDNYLDLTLESKCKLIEKGTREFGLKMFTEAGDETEETPIEMLIEDCRCSLEAGAYKVLVEAAELMDKQNGELRMDSVHAIADTIGLDNLIFELPWVWLDNVHWHQTFSGVRNMISKVGPHVNLGNVEMNMLNYVEMIRSGSGRKLDKDVTI